MGRFRIHWPAVFLAMIVSFLFEAAWFYHFLSQWLEGIGRSTDWLLHASGSPPVQYATAMLCSVVTAIVLTIAIQASGEQTIKRGIVCGAVLWLGFVATSWATEYVFEVRSLEIYAINVGYTLIDMMLIGAIVGGWRGESRSITGSGA